MTSYLLCASFLNQFLVNLLTFFFIILYLNINTEEQQYSKYLLLNICAVFNLVTFKQVLYWSWMSEK
ncbi:hypothetical protein Npun_F3916 [Nostoc punctiforme PCC 73102]|uniref:Uncharacterized protein n=1 Tax=Nostoc punctiforme (strain ATCC 29133 / PCC 73102) TaxID=63737 RepID=B2J5E2_NOSP7|nr:hypothetical protein Npun_F3916 [Nostoc punctiforme PCC 73102]